jgi:hypothetical protein
VVVNPVQHCNACYACAAGQTHECTNLNVPAVSDDGGFAEYMRSHYTGPFKLPAAVDYASGAFIEPLACAVNSMRKLDIDLGQFVVIFGPAPMGQMMVQMAKRWGAGPLRARPFLLLSRRNEMWWPDYWYGFPPMHYATHAVSPLLALAGGEVESVVCFGSGTIRKEYAEKYGSPFAIETALMKLRDSDLACEVTRSLFDTIRQYRESFDVYGTKLTFEWEQIAGENPVLYSGFEDAERVEVPDYGSRLPEGIARYTIHGVYDEEHEHTSFIQGAGHGGSHPHLAHEFVRAIVEGRESFVDARRAANWTMAGICAHTSAIQGGKRVEIPKV